MLISDINTAGASGQRIISTGGLIQISVSGTWNGGTVTLQRLLSDGTTWADVTSSTDDDYFIVESIGSAKYRTNTTHGGSAPVLVADVIFSSGNTGRVEAA